MKSNYICLLTIAALFISFHSVAQKRKKDNEITSYYSVRVYHFATTAQENTIDNYLANAVIPTLHKYSMGPVGVFKSIANDTASDKKIVVILSAASIEKLLEKDEVLAKDSSYTRLATSFLQAPYNEPPYTRYETMLLRAFPLAYFLEVPILNSPKEEHIYELRSYEGPTDGLYKTKVAMFNEGGEIEIFKRLGFNAVFYGEVISGNRMPNLVYMTSFENKQARDDHWKLFSNDPEWKRLSSQSQYQHNVSKADIWLMRAAAYSDY